MHLYTINTCGCASSNPGESAIGIEIYDHRENKVLLSYVTHIGFKSNHYAIHVAIITGVYWFRSLQLDDCGTVVLRSNNLLILKKSKKYFVPYDINNLKKMDHLYLMESHFLKDLNYEIAKDQENGSLKRIVQGATVRSGYPVNKLLLKMFEYFNIDLTADYKSDPIETAVYIDKLHKLIDFVDKSTGDPVKVSVLQMVIFKNYDIENHCLTLELDQSEIFFRDGIVDLLSKNLVLNKLCELFDDSKLIVKLL